MRNTTLLVLSTLLLPACDVGTSWRGAGGGYNHQVRQGETLFSIAEREYGNGLDWQLIHEANPWVDPDQLRVGETIYIPANERRQANLAQKRKDYMLDPGTGDFEREASTDVSVDPGGNRNIFRNILPGVADKTIFGMTVPKASSIVLIWFLVHALIQGFVLWITANVTFVREASFKKAMKAIFLTESLTFCTLVLLGVVGLMMVYVGTAEPGGVSGTQLFPTVEEYLRHPAGMGVAAFAMLLLYIILSLRFIPQVFGVELGRGFSVVFLAILLPHLLGFYLVGQKLGIIS